MAAPATARLPSYARWWWPPEMRILIAGLGSIGRRHLRNLQALGERDVLLYRTHRATLPEADLDGLPVETDLEAALALKPDAVIVANPTSLHLEVALAAARRGCALLIEKPVSHNFDHIDELQNAVREGGGAVLVGFQFRFHPLLLRLRELLSAGTIGRPLFARAHWGEYLPGWHPWEDYRQGYSARADLGGGALLTLCHPLDYLAWTLGPLTCSAARLATIGALGIDVDDYADLWLEGRDGLLGSVHLDYHARPASHGLEVGGERGTLRCDFTAGRLTLSPLGSGASLEEGPPPGFDRNDLFVAEMEHFLRLTRGEETSKCGLEEGLASLRLVVEARQRAEEHSS